MPTAWFWGDPHIKTLDGKEYTYNGWGEYTLVNMTTNDFRFTLQGRTGLAETETGTLTNATVFTAFGAEENRARVFVGLTGPNKECKGSKLFFLKNHNHHYYYHRHHHHRHRHQSQYDNLLLTLHLLCGFFFLS